MRTLGGARAGEERAETNTSSEARQRWRRANVLAMTAAVVAVAAIRAWHCLELPANTGDVLRHLMTGVIVGDRGLEWASLPLVQVHPSYGWIAWAGLPYNYPVLTLLFFAGVAAVSPTVLAVKVALTTIEGVNAVLVTRVTGSPWLGVLYWAYPTSIWWASREAQFEPLQSLFALAALVALRRFPAVAAALLGLAIQTKLTAGLLVPLFVVTVAGRGVRRCLVASAAFVAAFLPTALSHFYYPSAIQVLKYSTPMRYNPYWWNPFDAGIFGWNPTWLVTVNEVASYALVVGLAVLAVRSSSRVAWVAPLAFAVIMKVHSNVQFWYWITMPIFLVSIPDRRARNVLLVLLPLVDAYAIAQLAFGPFGYTVGNYYQFIR